MVNMEIIKYISGALYLLIRSKLSTNGIINFHNSFPDQKPQTDGKFIAFLVTNSARIMLFGFLFQFWRFAHMSWLLGL